MSTTYAEQNGQHAPASTTPDPRTPVAWQDRPDECNPYKIDEMGIRIPFGDLPNQTLPATIMAAMMADIMATHHGVFSAALVKALTGHEAEAPRATRGRPAKPPAE